MSSEQEMQMNVPGRMEYMKENTLMVSIVLIFFLSAIVAFALMMFGYTASVPWVLLVAVLTPLLGEVIVKESMDEYKFTLPMLVGVIILALTAVWQYVEVALGLTPNTPEHLDTIMLPMLGMILMVYGSVMAFSEFGTGLFGRMPAGQLQVYRDRLNVIRLNTLAIVFVFAIISVILMLIYLAVPVYAIPFAIAFTFPIVEANLTIQGRYRTAIASSLRVGYVITGGVSFIMFLVVLFASGDLNTAGIATAFAMPNLPLTLLLGVFYPVVAVKDIIESVYGED